MNITTPARATPPVVFMALHTAGRLCEDGSPALSLARRVLQDLSKAGDSEEPVNAVEVFVWTTELRFLLTLIDEQMDRTIAALRDAGVETQ